MNKYDLVIFDLDGTLMDTSEGIINCYNYTAKTYNKKELEKEKFKGIIGCPLSTGFKENYNMNDEEVNGAIKKYRERYAEKGIYEARTYDGIPKLLKEIKDKGCKTAVATLKLEEFAKKMLEDKNLAQYIDVIYGTNKEDKYEKVDLVNKAMEIFNIGKEKTVLVGDSKYDAIGAKEAGVDFIGVTYGLGFNSVESIESGYYTNYATKVEDIGNCVFS